MDPVIALYAPTAPRLSTASTALIPAARSLDWLRGGWRVLRLAPLPIVLLAFVPILVEILCQMLPHVGIVLSKWATPMAAALLWVLVDRRVRHGAFGVTGALHRWRLRWPALAVASLLGLGVFVIQLGVAAALAGPEQAWAIATGAVEDLHMSRAQLALMMASGVLPGLALMTVQPRILLDGRGVREAIVDNARVLLRAWKPVGLFTLASMGLVAAVMWWPVVLLALPPSGLAVGYAMYRDLYPAPVE